MVGSSGRAASQSRRPAVILYLRGQKACSIRGAYTYRRMLITLVATGAATYAGLFWFTKYLGIWFG